MLVKEVAATVPPAHTTTFEGTVTVDGVQATALQVAVPLAKQPVPAGVTVIATTSPGERAFTVNGELPVPVIAPPPFMV